MHRRRDGCDVYVFTRARNVVATRRCYMYTRGETRQFVTAPTVQRRTSFARSHSFVRRPFLSEHPGPPTPSPPPSTGFLFLLSLSPRSTHVHTIILSFHLPAARSRTDTNTRSRVTIKRPYTQGYRVQTEKTDPPGALMVPCANGWHFDLLFFVFALTFFAGGN